MHRAIVNFREMSRQTARRVEGDFRAIREEKVVDFLEEVGGAPDRIRPLWPSAQEARQHPRIMLRSCELKMDSNTEPQPRSQGLPSIEIICRINTTATTATIHQLRT